MCTSKMWGLSAPVVAILTGIVGIIISLFMYSQADYSYVLTVNSQYGMVILLTAFSVFILGLGCIGICAVYQMNDSLITAFWGGLIICGFGFAAGAAVGLATPLLLQSYGCSSSVYPAVSIINAQVTNATTKLCFAAPANCTCFLNSSSSINQVLNASSYSTIANYTYPISVQQCPNWTKGIYDTSIQAFQNNFNCAGWCAKGNFYMFSNLNRGIPNQACFQAFSNWFIAYSSLAYVPCIIFSGVSVLLVVWTCVFQKFCLHNDEEYLYVVQNRGY